MGKVFVRKMGELLDCDVDEGEWDRGLGRSILDFSVILKKILELKFFLEEFYVFREWIRFGILWYLVIGYE